MITIEQVKAARQLLGWSQLKLSLAADIGLTTVIKIETSKRRHFQRTLLRLQRAFEQAGVEFTNGDKPGVKLKVRKPTGAQTIEFGDA